MKIIQKSQDSKIVQITHMCRHNNQFKMCKTTLMNHIEIAFEIRYYLLHFQHFTTHVLSTSQQLSEKKRNPHIFVLLFIKIDNISMSPADSSHRIFIPFVTGAYFDYK